ncbi:hypothetical protein [Corallococcus sicarius]|uniref:hypothetical protein n=1 Tax=Corallococcus sicarius TaxID=2316726 RepID=UPI0011C39ACA|nr:hypothetical protein [Corallococcus sicarius]
MRGSRLPVSPSWCLASALLLMTGLAGCARRTEGVFSRTREVLAATDDFGMLLVGAGLSPEELPRGEEVTVQEARQLRLLLSLVGHSLRGFGPNVTADYLLAEVVTKGEAVSRTTLSERLGRFQALAVLRPDGYIVAAMTGKPLECVGPVGVQNGALRAGDYRVGAFYASEGQGYREDTSLPRLPARAFFLEAAGDEVP